MDNYLRLPTDYILLAIKEFNRIDKRLSNVGSYTTSNIAAALFNYFSGDNNNKLTSKDFLPFSDLDEDNERVDRRTARMFIELLEKKLIPEKVLMSAAKYIDSIKQYGSE